MTDYYPLQLKLYYAPGSPPATAAFGPHVELYLKGISGSYGLYVLVVCVCLVPSVAVLARVPTRPVKVGSFVYSDNP